MTADFESYNEDGVLQFSSKRGGVSLIAGPKFSLGRNGRAGVDLTTSYWTRMSRNSLACIDEGTQGLGILNIQGTSEFRAARNTALNIESGYLDVYDEQGNLNWSAASMPKIMNIVGVLEFPKNEIYYGSSPRYLDDDIWVNMSAMFTFEVITNIYAHYGLQLGRNGSGGYYVKGFWSGINAEYFLKYLPNTIYIPYARIPN